MIISGFLKLWVSAQKKSKKSKIVIFFDMIWCGFRYGAGYNDYLLCEFYLLTKEQRKTYMTRGKNNTLVRKLNNKKYNHFFNNKIDFNNTFSEYLKRDWLDMTKADLNDLKAFIKDKEYVMAKPASANCGKGIEKINLSEFTAESLFEYLKSKSIDLLEDYIVQNSKISKIYPLSVNTLRVVSVYANGKVNIVYAFIRIGNHNNVVDNLNHGGMTAPIDVKTGIVTHPAYDKEQNVYTRHPQTDTKIEGFAIPFWNDAKAMIENAGRKIPQMGYVGWDVCVLEDGVCLIEANQFPGHDILQLPPHVPNRIGMLVEFRKYIKI